RAPAEKVRFALGGDPASLLRESAMIAVASVVGHETETFTTLAKFIQKGDDRDASIRAIRRIPKSAWPKDQVRPLLEALLAYVSKLPASERTEPSVLDALQLGNDLAGLLPLKDAKDVRAKLGELGVNVILIRTVPHKMVYDRPEIYVEAGKPVVLV